MRHLRAPVVVFAFATAIFSVQRFGLALEQQQPSPPVFRAGTTFVNVDAYPRRDGKLVEHLAAENFQVFEDGKLQALASFEFVRSSLNGPDAARRDPSTVTAANLQAADPHNRVFVVYLDVVHTTVGASYGAHDPVISFLTRSIGANDLFAMSTPDLPVTQLTFGRRTETIDDELSKHWAWGEDDRLITPRSDLERRLKLCVEPEGPERLRRVLLAHREDLLSQHLESLVNYLGDLREARKNILFLSEGWVPQGPMNDEVQRVEGPIPVGSANGRLAKIGELPNVVDGPWCAAQLGVLYQIDFERRFRDLLTLARRANVSFYPIDVGGLKTTGAGAKQTLQELAENTDGTAVVGRNDVSVAMRTIADDLASHYLLGYYSTNASTDERFRQIQVKVNVPQVKVAAREGYFPSRVAKRDEVPSRPGAASPSLETALATLGRVRAAAALFTHATMTAGELAVVAEIAGREIDAGRWKGGGTINVSATSITGTPARLSADGQIAAGERTAVIRVPLGPETNIARTWRVTARIRGADGVLDDGADVTVVPDETIGAPLVFRAAASPRSPTRVTAQPQFSRTERIHLEWPVSQSEGPRTARLLGRRGDALPIPIAVSERTSGAATTVVTDLALSPIAQGDYVIELATKKGADTVTRLFAFRVAR